MESLTERLTKYKHRSRSADTYYDYKKALGEARWREIKKIAKREQLKGCVRTHDNNNGKKM